MSIISDIISDIIYYPVIGGEAVAVTKRGGEALLHTGGVLVSRPGQGSVRLFQ